MWVWVCLVRAAFSSLFDYLNKATHTEVNTTENLWTHRYTVRILFNLSFTVSVSFRFVSFHYHLRFFFCCSVLSFFLPCHLLNCENTAIDRYVSFHKMHEEILVVVFFCQREISCACWMFLGCMWTPRSGHTLQCVYEHCKHAQKAIAFMAAKVHTHANYGWQHVRSSVGIDGWLADFFRFTLKTYVPHQLTDWLAEI